MLHHKRLTNPVYFNASWYCHAHGVYACIPCQTAPVDEAEVTESETYKALQAENEQLRAELHRSQSGPAVEEGR